VQPITLHLGVVDFCLFERFKQQLSGRTVDGEENLFKTITRILSENLKMK
jgi:hypothetical protein